MPGDAPGAISCWLQAVWRIPEDLRMELALLDLLRTLQAYALYVNYEIYFIN
jgi:hypothetical protein